MAIDHGYNKPFTMGELRREIEKSAEYRHMQDAINTAQSQINAAMEGYSGMGIGPGVVATTIPIMSTWADTRTTEYRYYEPEPTPDSYPIYIDSKEYESLKKTIESQEIVISEQKQTLLEKDEIIEALSADINEIDSLREENEKLKAELETARANRILIEAPRGGGGIRPWSGGANPCPGKSVNICLRNGEMLWSVPADWCSWSHPCGLSPERDILSYEVV